MVKWMAIAVAVLAGLVALVALIGWLLPREHVATSRVVIRQPPDTVWMVVRDLGLLAEWWPDVERVEPVGDAGGREVWRQHLTTGPLTLAVVEDDPPHRLVTRIESSDGAPFGGTWTYRIEPVDGGSRVTIIEDGWIANPIFRFVSAVFMGKHGTMDRYLRALGRRFDEEVMPVHVE